MTPDEIAEIERPVPMGSEALWKLNEQKSALLAEVERLRAENAARLVVVEQQANRANTAEGQRNAYSDAMHQLVGVIGELQALVTLARTGDVDLSTVDQLDHLDRLVNGKAAPATRAVGRRDVTPSERRRLTAEIDQLREDSAKLNALERAGVDNWDGYSYAMEILDGETP